MSLSGKLVAPKPVRRNSNTSELKFELNSLEINPISPVKSCKSAIGAKQFDYSKNLISGFSKLEIGAIKKNFTHNNLSEREFENELEKNIEEESAKNEILNILNRNDSTYFQSYISEEMEEEENLVEEQEENIRITFPPLRCSNPFSKNFDSSENSQNLHNIDLRIFKFKSKNLSCFSSTIKIDKCEN